MSDEPPTDDLPDLLSIERAMAFRELAAVPSEPGPVPPNDSEG